MNSSKLVQDAYNRVVRARAQLSSLVREKKNQESRYTALELANLLQLAQKEVDTAEMMHEVVSLVG